MYAYIMQIYNTESNYGEAGGAFRPGVGSQGAPPPPQFAGRDSSPPDTPLALRGARGMHSGGTPLR